MPSRRAALGAIAASLTAGLAGCPLLRRGPNETPPGSVGTDWTPGPSDWAAPGRDPRNSNALGAAGPTEGTVLERRTDDTPEYHTRRYLVAATPGTAYLLHGDGSFDGTVVRALATDDWTERWRHRFEGDVGAYGLADGTLYFTREGRLTALDATDGSEVWRVDLYARLANAVGERFLPERDDFDAGLVPTPETVYAVSGYGFHGLSPADGAEAWRVAWPANRDGFVRGLAVGADAVWTLNGDDLFALSSDGLRELDVEMGFPRGLSTTPGPLVTDAGGETFSLAAFPADAGVPPAETGAVDPLWGFHAYPDLAGVHETSDAAVADGLAVVSAVVEPDGSDEQRASVVAVDTDSGTERWRYRLQRANPPAGTADVNAALSTPVVAGERVYVGVGPRRRFEGDAWLVEPPGAVLELDAETGAERRRFRPGIEPRGLAVAGEHCYVSDYDGSLVVLG